MKYSLRTQHQILQVLINHSPSMIFESAATILSNNNTQKEISHKKTNGASERDLHRTQSAGSASLDSMQRIYPLHAAAKNGSTILFV